MTHRFSNVKFLAANHRRGAAFLMLIFAVLLVVLGATQMLVQSEWSIRRHEASAARVESMQTAIDVAASHWKASGSTKSEDGDREDGDREADPRSTIVLPIDRETGSSPTTQRIELTLDSTTQTIVARWLRGDTELDSLTRSFDPQGPPGASTTGENQ